MNYLFDTNLISELIAQRPNQKVIDWIDSLDPESIYLSVITLGELHKGVAKLPDSRRKQQILEWLEEQFQVRFSEQLVEITTETMLVWGQLVARLEREGHPMPAIDSLIAASALAGGFTLVTRNTADFQHTGISLLNPWEL
jgi:Predicted nucleic acid-binding protein, contains PIN domain